jgi:hypothetical protein
MRPIFGARKSPLRSLGAGPPQRASALVAGSGARGAPSARHRPARRDCTSGAASQSVPARIERHGAPSTLLPGPALDRSRVGSPPDPRPPAPRETPRRRQPPRRPPRQLLQTEPPLSPPGARPTVGTLPEGAPRAFGLRSAVRNRTSSASLALRRHATRVAGCTGYASPLTLRAPGHSCCSLAAAQNAAVPSSADLLGSASVRFLRAPGLGNGGDPASAQPAPRPVHKNHGAPRASSLRGFKKSLSKDPPRTHARNPRPFQAASAASQGHLRGKPYPGQRPAAIRHPWLPSASDGRQPSHPPGDEARLASPRPAADTTDPGARHGPRHREAVARPLRRIQRRAQVERLRRFRSALASAAHAGQGEHFLHRKHAADRTRARSPAAAHQPVPDPKHDRVFGGTKV